uniref:Uncharacterized protein n=1 Tax=Lepeophtheirus salmonis TaxID=72036 RepID=A0A0K2UZI3_LEPSM
MANQRRECSNTTQEDFITMS